MKAIQTYSIVLFLLSFLSCIEEIDVKTEDEFTSSLVIEAIITNQEINQKILLSRAYLLEDSGPFPESNAQVSITDSNNNNYQFEETEPGLYESSSIFAAEPNLEYKLNIITSNGRVYSSDNMVLTQQTTIDDLYFERGFNENNDEGVLVKVDSYDPTGNSEFYRFTYEETFKIIAPLYSPLELVVIDPNSIPVQFALEVKEEQQQVCFRTDLSNNIVIGSTSLIDEDRLSGFRVRFVSRDNYSISHRYSILVTQYVQSLQGHEFYKSLKELSENESILSETQPGFISGNVFSVSDADEKVIGFFEVSSADSRRIYFNYEDLFPGEDLPPYIISCTLFSPELINPAGSSPLLDAVNSGNMYYAPNDDQMESEGPYDLTQPACGNCTVLGNNVPPDFWVE